MPRAKSDFPAGGEEGPRRRASTRRRRYIGRTGSGDGQSERFGTQRGETAYSNKVGIFRECLPPRAHRRLSSERVLDLITHPPIAVTLSQGATSSAKSITKITIGADGQIHVIESDGREYVAPKEKDQVSVAAPLLAENKLAARLAR